MDMKTQIDQIMDIMNKVINSADDIELSEQDTAAPAGDSGGGDTKPDYPTVTKWESGVTRGPANQIAVVKWSDIVKVTRGKANTLI